MPPIPPEAKTPRAIFFDAAGTLFGLREPVGQTYARIAAAFGVMSDAEKLDAAFRKAWGQLPPPLHPEGHAPPDDDREWWAELVRRTFRNAMEKDLAPDVSEAVFEKLYAHFADAGAWRLHDDVLPALDELSRRFRLLVLSNFDRRLRVILDGLGIARFFDRIIISSEVGASKPHERMFRAALDVCALPASLCLHVGDDARADGDGATVAGIPFFLVRRPSVTLRALAEKLRAE